MCALSVCNCVPYVWCGVLAGVLDQILFGLCCVSFCSVLARSALGRVCTSVQCSVQLYRTQYRVVCSTVHCSHSRLGREAVRAWPGVKQFTKQQVWDSLGRQSAQKLQQWDETLRHGGRGRGSSEQWADNTRTRGEQQVTEVSAFHTDTLQYLYTRSACKINGVLSAKIQIPTLQLF